MTQGSLFGSEGGRLEGVSAGRKLRDEALDHLQRPNGPWIDWMRSQAISVSKTLGKVSTDDLHEIADFYDYHPREPRAYGSVFHPRMAWKKIGYQASARRICHARPIPIWKYVG